MSDTMPDERISRPAPLSVRRVSAYLVACAERAARAPWLRLEPETLAERLGLSRATIFRALSWLREVEGRGLVFRVAWHHSHGARGAWRLYYGLANARLNDSWIDHSPRGQSRHSRQTIRESHSYYRETVNSTNGSTRPRPGQAEVSPDQPGSIGAPGTPSASRPNSVGGQGGQGGQGGTPSASRPGAIAELKRVVESDAPATRPATSGQRRLAWHISRQMCELKSLKKWLVDYDIDDLAPWVLAQLRGGVDRHLIRATFLCELERAHAHNTDIQLNRLSGRSTRLKIRGLGFVLASTSISLSGRHRWSAEVWASDHCGARRAAADAMFADGFIDRDQLRELLLVIDRHQVVMSAAGGLPNKSQTPPQRDLGTAPGLRSAGFQPGEVPAAQMPGCPVQMGSLCVSPGLDGSF